MITAAYQRVSGVKSCREASDDEPTEKEIALMRAASPAEAEATDALIVGTRTEQWRKVARVVGEN